MGPRGDEVISLKEHFEQRLEKLEDSRLEQRLVAIEKLEDARWEAHRAVHEMGQRAQDARFLANDAKLLTMNEFREQQNRERIEFVRQEVYHSEHKALETKVESLSDRNSNRISLLENNQSNQAGKMAAYTSVVGVIFVAVQVLLHFFVK